MILTSQLYVSLHFFKACISFLPCTTSSKAIVYRKIISFAFVLRLASILKSWCVTSYLGSGILL